MLMRAWVFALLAVPTAFAGDWFAVGLRAGAPLTDLVEVSSGGVGLEASTARFTIGPSAELLLPLGFGVEVDALYKRSKLTTTGGEASSAGSWEFPLLGKFRLPGGALRPYVAGGASFRSFGQLISFAGTLDGDGWGGVLAGGLEVKVGRVRLSPEIRYTRWGSGNGAGAGLEYSRNEIDFLFGLTF
jgi:hypothetical protein